MRQFGWKDKHQSPPGRPKATAAPSGGSEAQRSVGAIFQPFLALDLLRSVKLAIRPSMPLALISVANWLR